MRDGAWKLMIELGKPQLFNLAEDLSEKQDLSAQNPDRVKAMPAAVERRKNDVASGATAQPTTLAAVK